MVQPTESCPWLRFLGKSWRCRFAQAQPRHNKVKCLPSHSDRVRLALRYGFRTLLPPILSIAQATFFSAARDAVVHKYNPPETSAQTELADDSERRLRLYLELLGDHPGGNERLPMGADSMGLIAYRTRDRHRSCGRPDLTPRGYYELRTFPSKRREAPLAQQLPARCFATPPHAPRSADRPPLPC